MVGLGWHMVQARSSLYANTQLRAHRHAEKKKEVLAIIEFPWQCFIASLFVNMYLS